MSTPKTSWNDREMLNDLLLSEEFLTEKYNLSSNQSTTSPLQDELLHLLTETHQTETEITNELSKRGWYPSEQVSEEDIVKTKQKFLKVLNP